MQFTATYTIRLCKAGRVFETQSNVVDDGRPRPTQRGSVFDGRWKLLGVIRSSPTELVIDVEDKNLMLKSMSRAKEVLNP